MKERRLSIRWLVIGGLCLTVLGVILVVTTNIWPASSSLKSSTKPAGTISQDLAVYLALQVAKDDGLFGGWVDQPTQIHGKLLTFGQAHQFIGDPLSSNTFMAEAKDKLVWLIVLQGKFVEHVPGVPAPPSGGVEISPMDVYHSQMVIYVDGATGDVIEVTLISPAKSLKTDALPILSTPPDSTILQVPTPQDITPLTPEPTLSLAP